MLLESGSGEFKLVTKGPGLYFGGNEEFMKMLGVYNTTHLVER